LLRRKTSCTDETATAEYEEMPVEDMMEYNIEEPEQPVVKHDKCVHWFNQLCGLGEQVKQGKEQHHTHDIIGRNGFSKFVFPEGNTWGSEVPALGWTDEETDDKAVANTPIAVIAIVDKATSNRYRPKANHGA